MGNAWLIVALSLGAAMVFALSGTLKHVSAGHVPDAQTLHPGPIGSFIRATLTHRLWLGGIGCDIVGLVLQVVALHLGELAVVQPLLISGLLFTLVLRQRFESHHITARQFVWAIALCAALAGFLILATANRPALHHHESADRLPAVVAGLVGVVLIAACIEFGRRQRGRGRSAALLGIAVGIVYAGSAAVLKAVTDIAVRSPLALILSWQLYAFVALGAGGLLLGQLAFQAGPITASLPATAAIDPLLSIVVGVSVYDEHIRRGPGGGIALVALLVLLGVAVVQLARSAPSAVEQSGPARRARPDKPTNEVVAGRIPLQGTNGRNTALARESVVVGDGPSAGLDR
jgi:drug/metabolite transporter (DMT)-like permease